MKNVLIVVGIIAAVGVVGGWYMMKSSGVEVTPNGVHITGPDGEVIVNGDSVHVSGEGGTVDVNGKNVNVQSADGNTVSANASPSTATKKSTKNVVLILDASGSMNETVSGGKKIDIAKESAVSLIDKMDPATNLNVVVYGHTGSNSTADKQKSCAGIDSIYAGNSGGSQLDAKIGGIVAKGWTPIAGALTKAKTILATHPGEDNSVLLVSDGEESCGGDPIAVAKALRSLGVRVDVIGFDVTGVALQQLKNISVQAGGTYISVDDASGFKTVINGGDLHVFGPGGSVNIQGGNVNVNTSDTNVNTGSDGSVKINAPGMNINVDSSGVDMSSF